MPNLKLNKEKIIETLEFILKNDTILNRSLIGYQQNSAQVCFNWI